MTPELAEAGWVWAGRSALATALVVACITDARRRRIPNALTVPALIVALAWHALAPAGDGLFDAAIPGGLGILSSLAGAALCLAIFVVFYALRVAGAGDAKLMAAVGAYFGFSQSVGLVLAVLAAGGVLAVARMTLAQSTTRVRANLQSMFLLFVAKPSTHPASVFDPAIHSADRMPYAFAIAAGAVFYAVAKWAGWITTL